MPRKRPNKEETIAGARMCLDVLDGVKPPTPRKSIAPLEPPRLCPICRSFGKTPTELDVKLMTRAKSETCPSGHFLRMIYGDDWPAEERLQVFHYDEDCDFKESGKGWIDDAGQFNCVRCAKPRRPDLVRQWVHIVIAKDHRKWQQQQQPQSDLHSSDTTSGAEPVAGGVAGLSEQTSTVSDSARSSSSAAPGVEAELNSAKSKAKVPTLFTDDD